MTNPVPTWRFNKGDAVPEWLCDAVPIKPGSPRPSITFGGDVVVVETDAAFWILIAGLVPGDSDILINTRDGNGEVFAYPTSKPLYWARQVSWWHRDPGDGDDDYGRGAGPINSSPLVLQD